MARLLAALSAGLLGAACADLVRVPVQKAASLRDIAEGMLQKGALGSLRSADGGDSVPISDFENAQFFGPIKIGGQDFKVIFDTGSGHLLVPAATCDSSACDHHQRFWENKSSTAIPIAWADEPLKRAVDDTDRDTQVINFAMGDCVGQYTRDRVCLGNACAVADFIGMTEESDNPFKGAEWDGVLGLGQSLVDAEEFNIFSVLAKNATPHLHRPVFAVYLGRQIADEAEITFGDYYESRMASALTWVNVSQEGFWQFQFADILVDGRPTGLCKKYGKRQCQAVLDTGSSLMMGPEADVGQLISLLHFANNTEANCTNTSAFPKLGFMIQGVAMEMEPDDYMDRAHSPSSPAGVDSCWAHFMPIGDMGRGPIFVLGMPFMRAFYTVYDMQVKRIGIARAKHARAGSKDPSSGASSVPLVALRPKGDDLEGGGKRLTNEKQLRNATKPVAKLAAAGAANVSKAAQLPAANVTNMPKEAVKAPAAAAKPAVAAEKAAKARAAPKAAPVARHA
mmetsp:Transcript_76615/g.232229  ORF Transcript_76615/g.232229 Transcript_76615/m.232229 type:complete len:510 (+) Transcript_76615:72-1601(+)